MGALISRASVCRLGLFASGARASVFAQYSGENGSTRACKDIRTMKYKVRREKLDTTHIMGSATGLCRRDG